MPTDFGNLDNPFQKNNEFVLPHGFPSDIGIIGLPSSGKTLLASAMLHSLYLIPTDNDTGKGFERGVYRLDSKSSDHPYHRYNEHERAAQIFLQGVANIEDTGDFIQGTKFISSYAFWVGYEDNGTGRKGRYMPIGMVDTPGGFIENPEVQENFRFWEYVRSARGLIFTIAPNGGDEETHARTIQRLTDCFEGIKYKNKPWLAVCITKADQAADQSPEIIKNIQAQYDQGEINVLEDKLEEIIGLSSLRLLKSCFTSKGSTRMKIFITSAIGWYQPPPPSNENNEGKQEKENKSDPVPNIIEKKGKPKKADEGNDDGDTAELASPKDWRPCQAAYPFLWLFDQIERENIKKTRPPIYWRWVYKQRITNVQLLQEAVDGDRSNKSKSIQKGCLF